MSKTDRGFNIWKPIINDRCESIEFQESSAVGLNTWIRTKTVKQGQMINDAVVLNHNYEKLGLKNKTLLLVEAKQKGIEWDETFMHLEIEHLIELRDKINDIIEYQVTERATWYDDGDEKE